MMTTAGTWLEPIAPWIGDLELDVVQPGTAALSGGAVKVSVAQRLEDVAADWQDLTRAGVESPGQSYAFIREWIADRKIRTEDQRFVVAQMHGKPIALLPLHRRRVAGLVVYTWFPSSQVGCYAPIADYRALADLGAQGRASLWREMLGALDDADALYLSSMATEIGGRSGLFDELGSVLEAETLYRAEFASWEECDTTQRNRSRRKHDRQQGDKLAALGNVRFEVVTDPVAGAEAIKTMFCQRSARFRAQGIRDVFVCEDLIGFYQRAIEADSGLDVRLHVLRLNDEIVAMRYNIVHGDRMFCLISSMSEDADIQVGSPGRQCLLHTVQSVFNDGLVMLDMGQGFTDEKRHWCNIQMPLRHHYVGVTRRGRAAVALHQAFQRLRVQVKSRPAVKSSLRHVRHYAIHAIGVLSQLN